nr:beta-hexosaminidase subunit beta-like [Biomphalaria glabrata]
MKMIYRPIFLMFFFFFQCVHLEVTFIAERLPIQGNRPDPGSPWPMPKYWNKDAKVKTFIPGNIRLTQNRECDVTQEAFNRFVHRLQKVGGLESSTDDSTCFVQTEGSLQELKVVINDQLCPEYPQLGDSEKYELNITDTITIKASQVWGAVWGLETLGQLTYMVDGKWFVNQTFIGDEPRFSHRGLHLDTARHFYSIDVIKLNLDVMAMHKLNVFHWHIVDAQSFPYSSRRYPELAQKGAYSPGHIYSQSDVQDIINFARLRGIRVLPEFDTPGHAQSWGKSHPELLTTCYDGDTPERSVYGKHSEKEIMDPTKNSTFDFLRNFFDEIKDVFKDNFLHMGMDEVHYMCWESSPIIQEFLKDHGIPAGQYSGLETYYSNRLLDIIRPMNKRVVIWEDPVNHGAQVSNNVGAT